MTWVDGRRLFSLERDAARRGAIAAERARLLRKAATAKKPERDEERPEEDAYWRAEYREADYCCRNHEGGRR